MSSELPTLEQVEAAAELIRGVLLPTPQINWPLLSTRCGAELWVKHENHNPTGAFKVRGGLIYVAELKRRSPEVTGVIAATRGNHGQSIALAANHFGLKAIIVVPRGNSREKNAAMRGYGAELIEHGTGFEEALEYSKQLAAERQLHAIPTFHPTLATGAATYALELLKSVEDLHTVYVPIGLGSGIWGVIAVRDALGLATRIVGVVAKEAPTYALSFAKRQVVSTPEPKTIADGLAVRSADPRALEIICRGADRIVTVDDDEIRSAMKHLYTDTHNLAEGAGAATLTAVMQERASISGRRIAIVLSGSNIAREKYLQIVGGSI